MDISLILLIYLCYRNGVRAKVKGQHAILWGLATAAAYVFFMMIGLYFVVFNFCKDSINFEQMSLMDKKAQQAAAQQLIQIISANPLHIITIELFGIGGYLLVRYILDRKPDKQEPEMHWMDKMEQ